VNLTVTARVVVFDFGIHFASKEAGATTVVGSSFSKPESANGWPPIAEVAAVWVILALESNQIQN
jgi:hypothetical protein